MITALSPEECADRLRPAWPGFMSGSKADSSGFRLAKGTRTAIRIRGTFDPRSSGGTIINFRIEFLPVALAALAVGTPLGLLVLVAVFGLAHESVWELWPVILMYVLGLGANLWLSDRQARRLIDFVSRRLEAA